jgi:putative acetyltransferase
MDDATYRNEEPGDGEDVRKLHLMTFPTKEEADLVDRLRGSGNLWLSMVAEAGHMVVGHIAFSPMTLAPPDPKLNPVVGLAPVAVHPGHQRKGIGTKLIQAGLDVCREAGYAAVIVFGSPGFYKRFGFVPARTKGLRNAYGAIDLFMVLEFKPGTLNRSGVLATFGPEFAGTTPLSAIDVKKPS